MSRFKVINLIDKLFVTVSVFLILYSWINFYIKDLATTFILSCIFTFACIFVLYFVLDKKAEKKHQTKNYAKQVEENFIAFKLSSKQEKLELLNRIFQINHTTLLKNDRLFYVKDNKKILLILATHFDNLNNSSLLNLIDEFNCKEADGYHIFCNQSNVTNLKIFTDKEIFITTKESLFADYFFKHNIYPNCSTINFNQKTLTWKSFAKKMFEKKKAKAYFLYGLLLLFSSIILPFHAYYIVIGSMLLLFSIICRILPA